LQRLSKFRVWALTIFRVNKKITIKRYFIKKHWCKQIMCHVAQMDLSKLQDWQTKMIKNIFTLAPTVVKMLGSMAHNVFGLGEGGDFHHKCWCGEPNFD
jgi:hypothetical protein